MGGDLYDFFLRDNNLYFCIGDVSGKGVPAALVMTSVCGAFRLLAESETEPVRIVSRMNDMMIRDSSMTIFVPTAPHAHRAYDAGCGRFRG